MDFKEICKVFGKKIPGFVPEEYSRMMRQLVPSGIQNEDMPWQEIMPLWTHQVATETLQRKRNLILEEIGPDIDYYEQIYSKTKTVFDFLRPSKANGIKLKLLSKFNNKLDDEKLHFLEHLTPDKYGFLPVPKYTLCDTLTGRMKITQGPNILLLPKEYRNSIFQSRFGREGSIWYLDFISLEPRIMLIVKEHISRNGSLHWDAGPSCQLNSLPQNPLTPVSGMNSTSPSPATPYAGYLPLPLSPTPPLKPKEGVPLESLSLPEDVYTHALRKLKLSGEIDRNKLKQIVLPQVYGQAKSSTIEALEKQGVRDPDEVVDMVNDFFGIDTLREQVLQGFVKTGCSHLRTFYHRHLTPEDSKPHALLNYFVQSTAVDVALLGFLNILTRISSTPEVAKSIVPIFILHDALLLDVHQSAEHLLPKLQTLGASNILGFEGHKFWLSANKMS